MKLLSSLCGVIVAFAIVATASAQAEQVKKPGAVFKAPGSHTMDVALSPDGKILARAGTGKTIDLWDVASGKQLHTLKGHTKSAVKVAFSPSGKTLASVTGYQVMGEETPAEVKLWDVATGKERVPVKGHPHGVVFMAFSADGKTLATSSVGLGDFLGAVNSLTRATSRKSTHF